ncbi:pop4 domain protein [Cystoisospora suis]|uniref:Pop4 domain protein n=1 Tax=Cystoisospora suis TaxID=483139 RepID=A0A2C6KTH7_9APIC|nr:pop4 domain protein [Cystoisospora suis]
MPPKKRQAVTVVPSPPSSASLPASPCREDASSFSGLSNRYYTGEAKAKGQRLGSPGTSSPSLVEGGSALVASSCDGSKAQGARRQHAVREEQGSSEASLLSPQGSFENKGNHRPKEANWFSLPRNLVPQDGGQFTGAPATQEQLAAAYASSLSSAGISGLYHPLYERLHRAPPGTGTLPAASDGRLLQDILELCPLRAPAAALVESKLSSRALRLDTHRSGPCASASLSGGDVEKVSAALNAGADKSKNLLRLSRTKARASGIFDVRGTLSRNERADGKPRSFSVSPTSHQPLGSPSSKLLSRLRFDDLHGLRRLWLQYTENVCGTGEARQPTCLIWATLPAPGLPEKTGRGALVGSGNANQATRETAAKSLPERIQAGQPLRQRQADNGRRQRAYDRCTVLSKCAFQGAEITVVRARTPGLVGIEGTVVEETQQSLVVLCQDQRLRRLLKNCVVLAVRGSDGSNYFLHARHLQHSAAGRSKVKLKPKTSLLLK